MNIDINNVCNRFTKVLVYYKKSDKIFYVGNKNNQNDL